MNTLIQNKKVVGLVVLVMVAIGWYIMTSNTNQQSSTEGNFVTTVTLDPQNDALSLAELSVKLQTELNIEGVVITPVTGDILEIRINKPESVTKENLAIGTAYVFGFVQPHIGKNTQKVRVIYTKNFLDETLFEASYVDITNWVKNSTPDSTFAKQIKFVQLAK